jgi:hypothetical protein
MALTSEIAVLYLKGIKEIFFNVCATHTRGQKVLINRIEYMFYSYFILAVSTLHSGCVVMCVQICVGETMEGTQVEEE